MPPAEALPLSTPTRTGLGASFGWRLPSTPDAAGAARRVVSKLVGEQMAQEMLDDALLVISELVTNAVLHGNGDIEVRLAFDGQRVRGDVTDEGKRFTQQQPEHDPEQVGGHGLFLVSRIADRWGLHADTSGVWFEILERPL